MCKCSYQIVKEISNKIMEDQNIALDIKDQDTSNFIKRTIKDMASLFNINIKGEWGEKHNVPDRLATLVELEVLYRKQKNTPKTKKLITLIKYIRDNQWNKIKADDICSFFLPIFNSNYIKENEKYFLDFEDKLYFCLDYYSMINPNCIPAYLSDDIISFINCVYYQEEVPTRDYKKLLEILESGEI